MEEAVAREIFLFNDPVRLVIGTVGVPGEREFFIQVKNESELRSFAMEKGQASALAERCREILREIAFTQPSAPRDNAPLETPIESEFPSGVMSLLWDAERGRFLLEIQSAISPIDGTAAEDLLSDVEDGAPAILRVYFSAAQAKEFVRRTEEVVAAGRQPCMFCGGPIDISGHLCPRANGYRRRD